MISVSITNVEEKEAGIVLKLLQEAFSSTALPYTVFQSNLAVSWLQRVICEGEEVSKQRLRVARLNGEILGFTIARQTPDRSFLSYIGTTSSHGNLGVGSTLLDDFESSAWKRGCVEVALDVFVSNRVANQWYKRRGYRTVREKLFGRLALDPDSPEPSLTGRNMSAWREAIADEREHGFSQAALNTDRIKMVVGVLGGQRLRLMSWSEGAFQEAVDFICQGLARGRSELVVVPLINPPVDALHWHLDKVVEMRKGNRATRDTR